ncbi:MAG: hypothetical protein PHE17_09250 [Thiothrix sp.]|uniref:hypothetical protein n=1 Tax=Thiothrix sp. TaxID=1032 RepID=UPI00262FA09C|nr:hypothetical protein [Thiothrix sp.]MDD5393191.1 hypothetical protein [Thiothrix sp.]
MRKFAAVVVLAGVGASVAHMQFCKIAPPKATRKNFTMPEETARELDFLATLLHKKQNQVIHELIHNVSTAQRNDMRLAKLK